MTQRSETDIVNEHLERIARMPREVNPDPIDLDDLGSPRPLVWICVAWLIATAIALILMSGPAKSAELRAVATVAAWHEYPQYWCGPDARFHDYASATPGIGVGADLTDDVMVAAGAWRTSHSKAAAFALVDWRPLHWGPASVGLFAGASSGYCRGGNTNSVLPLAGATVRVDIDRFAVHVLAVPPTDWKPTTVALAVSMRF